jgi:hypothetical protein
MHFTLLFFPSSPSLFSLSLSLLRSLSLVFQSFSFFLFLLYLCEEVADLLGGSGGLEIASGVLQFLLRGLLLLLLRSAVRRGSSRRR